MPVNPAPLIFRGGRAHGTVNVPAEIPYTWTPTPRDVEGPPFAVYLELVEPAGPSPAIGTYSQCNTRDGTSTRLTTYSLDGSPWVIGVWARTDRTAGNVTIATLDGSAPKIPDGLVLTFGGTLEVPGSSFSPSTTEALYTCANTLVTPATIYAGSVDGLTATVSRAGLTVSAKTAPSVPDVRITWPLAYLPADIERRGTGSVSCGIPEGAYAVAQGDTTGFYWGNGNYAIGSNPDDPSTGFLRIFQLATETAWTAQTWPEGATVATNDGSAILPAFGSITVRPAADRTIPPLGGTVSVREYRYLPSPTLGDSRDWTSCTVTCGGPTPKTIATASAVNAITDSPGVGTWSYRMRFPTATGMYTPWADITVPDNPPPVPALSLVDCPAADETYTNVRQNSGSGDNAAFVSAVNHVSGLQIAVTLSRSRSNPTRTYGLAFYLVGAAWTEEIWPGPGQVTFFNTDGTQAIPPLVLLAWDDIPSADIGSVTRSGGVYDGKLLGFYSEPNDTRPGRWPGTKQDWVVTGPPAPSSSSAADSLGGYG